MRYLPILILLLVATRLPAQSIEIGVRDPHGCLVHVDSTNWNEAWVEVSGRTAGSKLLGSKDITARFEDRTAEILSVDSVGFDTSSHVALSLMLDNSSSMFHTYDSLTRLCDTLTRRLPRGILYQAVTFDIEPRSSSHEYTKRESTFIAQSGFRDSLAVLSRFWHFFDTIRTHYTPLYDAIATIVRNIQTRRFQGDSDRVDVILAITDGADNASRVEIETLRDLLRTSHVRLYTITLRSEIDRRLQWLSHEVSGDDYTAEDIADLTALLKDLSLTLTQRYHIRYRFPSLGPAGSR